MENFIITEKFIGSRLDKFLAKKFPDKSRSFLKKLIENKAILINNRPAKPSHELKTDDIITLKMPEKKNLDVLPQKIDLNIIFEDKDIIVINKEAGTVVHPDQAHYKNTLVNALLNYYPPIINVGEKERPGIVHRLDKDTSGLIIVAKNNNAYAYLVDLFKNKLIQKKYYALVFGKVADEKGIISYSLRKDSHDKKIKVAQGKEALTRYRTLDYYHDDKYHYTLLEVSPETGRTHQIRVHLKQIGHPIVGDPKYKFKKFISPAYINRQLLHAFWLNFTLPSGVKKIFKANPPKDFQDFSNSLNKD